MFPRMPQRGERVFRDNTTDHRFEWAEQGQITFSDYYRRGEAFGLYHALTGALALPASLWMGWVWQVWGSRAAFLTSGALAVVAVIMLASLVEKQDPTPSEG